VSFWRAHNAEAELVLIPIGDMPVRLPVTPCVTLPPPAYRVNPHSARIRQRPEQRLPVVTQDDCWELDAAALATAFEASPFVSITFDAQVCM